jgi:hypothetical protein
MTNHSRPAACAALLLALAACAHPSSQQPRSGPPDASFTLASKQAYDACVRDGLLVVYNGESYPVQLLAWYDMGLPTVVRSGIPAGRVDTIADLPHSTRMLEARPDEAHAMYAPHTTGGPPTNKPRHVYYSCARPSQTD